MEKIKLAIIFHFHQPYYKDPFLNEYAMPWVRMHTIKDYFGMAQILEEFPKVKLHFNFVPSLLKQVNDYIERGLETRDRNLLLSKKDPSEFTPDEEQRLLKQFFMAHPENMISPIPRYKELFERIHKSGRTIENLVRELSAKDYRDIQVLFNLSWFHKTIIEKDKELQTLLLKGRHFDEREKEYVLMKQIEIIRQLFDKYNRLAKQHRIELMTSPKYHPIVPLLLNWENAREAEPEITIPQIEFSGYDDAAEQFRSGLVEFENIFGFRAKGMWPPECAVSFDMLPILLENKFEWFVTDEGILQRTLYEQEKKFKLSDLYKPYKINLRGGELFVFFRDREISDKISFTYKYLTPEEAVKDFSELLIRKAKSSGLKEPVVVLALDGENPWEHYQNGGVDFLRKLYDTISNSPVIETILLNDYINEKNTFDELKSITPGSWINSNFHIWFGDEEDRSAWELLAHTKNELDKKLFSSNFSPDITEARECILVAEGSDWYWWFGNEFSSALDKDFDLLFRRNLLFVYEKLQIEPPLRLYQPIKKKVVYDGIFTEPTSPINIDIDGQVTSYFEWCNAGVYRPHTEYSFYAASGSRVEPNIIQILFGGSEDMFFLRVDFEKSFVVKSETIKMMDIYLKIIESESKRTQLIKIFPEYKGKYGRSIFRNILEFGAPYDEIFPNRKDKIEFFLVVFYKGEMIGSFPIARPFELNIPTKKIESKVW